MSHAVHAKSLSDWIKIHDAKAGLEAAFPGNPIEMSFDLPFQNTPSKGNLHLYSVPLETGVIILSILKTPDISDKILTEEPFKECVDAYLVKYLFQEPHVFHQKQTFKSKKEQYEGLPLMSFQFSYWDGHHTQWMKGAAFVKDGVLYKLIYLAPKEGYDNKLLEHFVGSFHLKSKA